MKILKNYDEIQSRLKDLGEIISGQHDEVTLLIALSGGVYTGIDLSKYIKIPCKLEFVKISSYGNERQSGIIELKWISASKGKNLGNVVIVDDICDTGNTLTYLVKYLKNNYQFSSIKTLTLLDKPIRREVNIEPDYVGFSIDNVFVYGYGLDNKEYDRNITDVKVLED